MRSRVMSFVSALREAGVRVSVGEVDDALRAVAAVGIERERLREALAVTLVKDESDRTTFDPIFDAHFPLVSGERLVARRKRQRHAGEGEGGGRGRGGEGAAGGVGVGSRADTLGRSDQVRLDGPETSRERRARRARVDGARARELRSRLLAELDAEQTREAIVIAESLGRQIAGRVRRRDAVARRGRVDFRRTARHALATDGVPLVLHRRGRRPDRPDLVALCDVSGSVAAASECLLALLTAMPAAFRRSDTYAFVDRLVPVSVERGHVAPGGPLDLYARSDFGRVLGDLERAGPRITRRTVVVVLGDARNNRRPPRADLLRRVAEQAGRVVWLVPEPAARWNGGDSVLAAYAPACDVVLECRTLGALADAVRRHVV